MLLMWGHMKKNCGKQKQRKLRLLSSTEGDEYFPPLHRIINRVKSKITEIETAEIEECLYIFCYTDHATVSPNFNGLRHKIAVVLESIKIRKTSKPKLNLFFHCRCLQKVGSLVAIPQPKAAAILIVNNTQTTSQF